VVSDVSFYARSYHITSSVNGKEYPLWYMAVFQSVVSYWCYCLLPLC